MRPDHGSQVVVVHLVEGFSDFVLRLGRHELLVKRRFSGRRCTLVAAAHDVLQVLPGSEIRSPGRHFGLKGLQDGGHVGHDLAVVEVEPFTADAVGCKVVVEVLLAVMHEFELDVVFGGFTARVAGLVFTNSLFHGAGGQAQFHVAAPRLVEVVLFADAVDHRVMTSLGILASKDDLCTTPLSWLMVCEPFHAILVISSAMALAMSRNCVANLSIL